MMGMCFFTDGHSEEIISCVLHSLGDLEFTTKDSGEYRYIQTLNNDELFKLVDKIEISSDSKNCIFLKPTDPEHNNYQVAKDIIRILVNAWYQPKEDTTSPFMVGGHWHDMDKPNDRSILRHHHSAGVVDIDDYRMAKVSEVACMKCLHRWLACRPEDTLLKSLECPNCHEQGYAIETGEIITDQF